MKNQQDRLDLDQFNGPVNKKSHALLGFAVMISVLLLSWYFNIKVNKAYPEANEEYIFVVQSASSGDYQVFEELGFWERAQAYVGFYKITPYKRHTVFHFGEINAQTNDGMSVGLEMDVRCNFDDVDEQFWLVFGGEDTAKLKLAVNAYVNIASKNAMALMSIKDIMASKAKFSDNVSKLISDQLSNGLYILSETRTDSTRIIGISMDNGKIERGKYEYLSTVDISIADPITFKFDDSTLKRIEERARLQLLQQKLIRELEEQKTEMLRTATEEQKQDLLKYFAAKEIQIRSNFSLMNTPEVVITK